MDDLATLSGRATQGTWLHHENPEGTDGKHRIIAAEPGEVVAAMSPWAGANARFIVELVNSYRRGELIERAFAGAIAKLDDIKEPK